MAVKQIGTITKWQDDKGFGFIKYDKGTDVFFHISEFKSQTASNNRPFVGDKVEFQLGLDTNGRPRANQVQQLNGKPRKSAKFNALSKNKTQHQLQDEAFKSSQSSRLFIGIGFYMVLAVIALMGKLNWIVLGWYVVIGSVTFLTYAKDKSAAQQGKWRTPESTLHVLSLLGGWVGALLAQTYLRHKSKKAEFRLMYYLTVIINLVGLLFLLTGHDFQ